MTRPRGPVLLTGAFGHVGRRTLAALIESGYEVVATDQFSSTTAKVAARFAKTPGTSSRWLDLRDRAAVLQTVEEVQPTAVIHVAAIIPPLAYRQPTLAYDVNEGGTAHLVDAVEAIGGARFVLVSTMGVYGSRNPHTMEPVSSATPPAPCDVYGGSKLAAEHVVTSSTLDWTILRLGAVVSPELVLETGGDALELESMLPSDERIHAVDIRDVATALVSAAQADVSGKVLLIGGDATCRLTKEQMGNDVSAALGIRGGLPAGRRGDPADDGAWFAVDWMDTAQSERLLEFQRHSWHDTLRSIHDAVGWRRPLLLLASPVARLALAIRSPYRHDPAGPAQPWQKIAKKWGDDAVMSDRPADDAMSHPLATGR
ncbi:MAG: NAD-dependent epimerase/dehydratase family protein [Solirubrobacteraceae bacterium]|nr:NAD-dependent epimerase/dehydratase family protein [Solirubrobacteraceae bacterium]